MVSSTSVSMVSTLAGLRRLEAQIYHAMMEVGASDAGQAVPSDPPRPAPEQVIQDAQLGMAQASGAITSLDVMV